ncbi:hypothetical protein H310_04963 [Aphanomyces invadans]|uniref:Uncharacterized protein n=1 Tax=Aphanomyces invadans TaxID=157072 RepID=A0A024UBG6_9STRA|nr:hypothetical protein H310_04963 [Aphanomyces invadans]ETW03535.1 hypothetical protein H310_04963 [Aphanomyces invadans]|eukprot:XP_008867764.1 hypothetical protein H310_04963 [Aphanomyces invadans]
MIQQLGVRHHNVEADIEGNPQVQEPPRTKHLLLTYLNRNVTGQLTSNAQGVVADFGFDLEFACIKPANLSIKAFGEVAQLLECSSHLIKSPGILSRLKKKNDLKNVVEFKATFSRLQKL